MCNPIFIAALFTIANIWKHPKCPSVDEGIKKLAYLHNGILCIRKREGFLPFATPHIELEISQSVKDKYHMTSLIRGI